MCFPLERTKIGKRIKCRFAAYGFRLSGDVCSFTNKANIATNKFHLVSGSTRRTSGPRSGVRSRRAAAHSLASNAPSNHNGLQNDHPHELHEAGKGNRAQGLGASQNGTIAVSNAGQSISIDSGGSSSRGSDAAMATPVPNSHMSRLQHLDAQREDFEPPETVGTRKKKRGPRVAGGEKGGRGLRQFSMKVCEKVESKGRTTYNEVADELVAEFANLDSPIISPDRQQYDEKNIRRRVYDALNVLMAMDIISKEKKEIKWKGLPSTSISDSEQLKAEHVRVKNAIEKKTSYLRELEEQIIGLQNLVQRNERLYGSGNAPSGGVALPFILVQTRPHATVEVEISEDMQLVHFDFNSTPFGLHDDAYVLKEMKFCKSPRSDGADFSGRKDSWNGIASDENSSPISNMYQHCVSPPPMASVAGSYQLPCTPSKLCNSPPVPGILKARVKHENTT